MKSYRKGDDTVVYVRIGNPNQVQNWGASPMQNQVDDETSSGKKTGYVKKDELYHGKSKISPGKKYGLRMVSQPKKKEVSKKFSRRHIKSPVRNRPKTKSPEFGSKRKKVPPFKDGRGREKVSKELFGKKWNELPPRECGVKIFQGHESKIFSGNRVKTSMDYSKKKEPEVKVGKKSFSNMKNSPSGVSVLLQHSPPKQTKVKKRPVFNVNNDSTGVRGIFDYSGVFKSK